jgi:hypothetical protein
VLVLAANNAVADTVFFHDGHTMSGSFVGGDARTIRMAVGDRVETIRVADVDRISFGDSDQAVAPPVLRDRPDDRQAAEQPPPPPYPAQAPPPSNYPDQPPPPAYSAPPPPPPYSAQPPAAAPGPPPDRRYDADDRPTIPSGATLTIRMVDSVDSERDYVGKTFQASLDEPVFDPGGRTLVPRGADVVVKLVNDVQSGKIEGRTVLTLDIVSLRVNGRVVDVDTTAVTEQSASRGARSGKVIGGTAVLGAIIGGIAGGGRGAAIGAGAGAGAGTVAQVATKGQRVRVPSETRLTFTLQQPVRL